MHAVATTPAGPLGPLAHLPPAAAAFPVSQSGRLPHCPFRGLLSVHSRYGLHGRQVAQGDPLHQKLRPLRYLHDRSDCYRLERELPGGFRTH